ERGQDAGGNAKADRKRDGRRRQRKRRRHPHQDLAPRASLICERIAKIAGEEAGQMVPKLEIDRLGEPQRGTPRGGLLLRSPSVLPSARRDRQGPAEK